MGKPRAIVKRIKHRRLRLRRVNKVAQEDIKSNPQVIEIEDEPIIKVEPGIASKKELELEVTLDELPEDWNKALETDRLSVDATFPRDLIRTCPACDKNVLKEQGKQFVWECQECSGLFHPDCWHLECQLSKKYKDWKGPVADPPRINLEGFHKSERCFAKVKISQNELAVIKQFELETESKTGELIKRNIYHPDYRFFYNFNADLRVMHADDYKILLSWYNGAYYPPVKVMKTENKGLGVIAIADIKKGQFICEYAGEVLPVCCQKDRNYAFLLSYGPNSKTEFEICPGNYWSLGNYLNHSQEKDANVESLRLLTPEGVVIVLVAKKEIKRFTELTYCYNGFEQNYDTTGFN